MAKKSFGLGIDALLKNSETRNEEKRPSKEEGIDISKKQNTGIKTCLQIDENLLLKFKAVAHWERLSQRELIELLINDYLITKGEKFVDNAIKHFSKE